MTANCVLKRRCSGILYMSIDAYCILGCEDSGDGGRREDGGRARDSVNFRKFSPCIARAARAEYCRFDTSAFFYIIKRGSLYT